MTPVDRKGTALSVGDEVMFCYWFPPNIPKRLMGTTGNILRVTNRGKIVVLANSDAWGVRTIWPRYVQRQESA